MRLPGYPVSGVKFPAPHRPVLRQSARELAVYASRPARPFNTAPRPLTPA